MISFVPGVDIGVMIWSLEFALVSRKPTNPLVYQVVHLDIVRVLFSRFDSAGYTPSLSTAQETLVLYTESCLERQRLFNVCAGDNASEREEATSTG